MKTKFKKWLSYLAVIMMVFMLLPAMVFAADSEGRFTVESGKTCFYQNVAAYMPNAQTGISYEFKYELNEENHTAALVVANSGNSAHYAGAEITVPGTITYQEEDYTVTTIGKEAFRYSQIKTVNLPDTITTIGPSAFIYCYYVEKINIPAGLTSIGTNAFWGCQALKEINIPNGVSDIPEGAFNQCWAAGGLTIPSSVKTIGDSAFSGLGDQSGENISLTIPKNVTSIGYEAFGRTKAIKSVTVEANRTDELQLNGAFRVCDGLDTVDIQSGKVMIGNNEFQMCPNLGSVTLAEGIETLGMWAFNGAAALTEAVIPSTVTSLGSGAFYECENAVIYYPSAAVFGSSYTLSSTKTRAAYSVNADGKTVTIDSVNGTALAKTPETVGGRKISAVPEEYRPADRHFHYFGEDNSLVYCSICEALNPDHVHVWGEPTWKWTEDCSGAAATFPCTGGAGHKEEVTAAITSQTTPATCTQDGATVYTASVTFDGDNFTDTKTTVIKASGHNMVKHDRTEAACTTAGNVEYWHCNNCGKDFADEEGRQELADTAIRALGHKPVKTEAKAPTATKAGNIAYWYCAECGKYFKDQALTQEISKADTVLAATGTPVTPTPALTSVPATGDGSHTALWLALFFAGGGALTGVWICGKKRKCAR